MTTLEELDRMEEQVKENLKAIRRTREILYPEPLSEQSLLQEKIDELKNPSIFQSYPITSMQKIPFLSLVRGVVKEMPREFSTRDVRDRISEKYPTELVGKPKSHVSAALVKLKSRGLLVVVKESSGKEPAVYRLPDDE